jgi:DNA-binding SARP family transcriptional activator/tetratricopeptide (TPR) repeat protein
MLDRGETLLAGGDPGLRFGLLGPFEVWQGARALAVSSPKHRALLATLVVQAGRTVPTGELARAVWGADQPANPRRAVQVLVTRLRVLLPHAIGTRPDGYAIDLQPEQVDLSRFRSWLREADRAAERGDLDKEAGALVDALAQWRGQPLADVPSDVLQREVAPQLSEQRLRVVARRIDVDLKRGRHAELVAELSGLVAEHPLRERFWAQLMAALSATGRRADALAAYHTVRRRLADELGIDPGEELQRQYATILMGQPRGGTGSAILPVPRQLPAEVPGFAGRTCELDRLDGLLAEPADRPVVVVVAGMAGVGKTALVARWARRIADNFPDGQLWTDLRGFDAGQAVAAGHALTRFLRVLGVPASGVPPDPEEQACLYRSLMDGRRMLVVLDNASSAEQVRPLLPGGPGSLVVVTSRHHLTSLVAVEAAYPLTLGLLHADEARQLLAARLGSHLLATHPAATAQIIASCGGLPLALAIVAARAATRAGDGIESVAAELRNAGGSLAVFAAGDSRTDVRLVLSSSYRALTPAAAQLFRLLGVHPGPDLTVPAAASLAGTSAAAARDCLAELVRAHLVTEQATGRYALHDLLRAYAAGLAGACETERRDAERRLLDHYLHTADIAARRLDPNRDPIGLGTPRPGVSLEEIANHDRAMEWLAREQQVLLATVHYAAQGGHHDHAWKLAWTIVHYLDRRGYWHEMELASRAALAAASQVPDPLARACAHRGLGQAYSLTGQYDDARGQFLLALAQFRELDDHTRQARVHLSLGWLASEQDRYPEALSHARQALDLFRKGGHQAGQADALNAVGWCYAHLGDHRRALGYCEQALDVVQAIGSREGAANTLDSLGYVHQRLGHHREAIACYRRSLQLLRELGERYLEGVILTHLGEVHHAAGDRDAARVALGGALQILAELDHPDADRVRVQLDALPG